MNEYIDYLRRYTPSTSATSIRLMQQRLSCMQEKEYAIEVILSDESQYTVYRMIKEIAIFQVIMIIVFLRVL